MAKVELSFAALPAHLRTARLVTAAVARRSGVPDEMIDEVKLAVGEACARALAIHEAHAADQHVVVELREGAEDFAVIVRDRGPAGGVQQIPAARKEDLPGLVESVIDDEGAVNTAALQLALIAGLVDELTVEREADHTAVRMRWSLPAGAASR